MYNLVVLYLWRYPYLCLVWCDEQVGGDEECPVLCGRNHVVRLVPHPEIVCCFLHTVCPRSSDPFYIVSYYKKWVTSFGHIVVQERVHPAPSPLGIEARFFEV